MERPRSSSVRVLGGQERPSTTIKRNLKNLARRSVELIAELSEKRLRDRHNVELVLSAALREGERLQSIHYPVAYVEFLRSCLEHTAHSVIEIKAESDDLDSAAKRFATLVDELRSGLPAIEFPVAQEIALIADRRFQQGDEEDA